MPINNVRNECIHARGRGRGFKSVVDRVESSRPIAARKFALANTFCANTVIIINLITTRHSGSQNKKKTKSNHSSKNSAINSAATW